MSTFGATQAFGVSPYSIDGCYEPGVVSNSGESRLSTFKDLLLLGKTVPGPPYVAISASPQKGECWFSLFSPGRIEERYLVSAARNNLEITPDELSFSVYRKGSGDGMTTRVTSSMKLVLTEEGDLRADVGVVTETRGLFFSSKKKMDQFSFHLRRVRDFEQKSIEVTGGIVELPGLNRGR